MTANRKLLLVICILGLTVAMSRSLIAAPLGATPRQAAPLAFAAPSLNSTASGAALRSLPLSTRLSQPLAQAINTPTPTRTPTPINVGNFVWNDLDQDGRQDAGEPGLAGVTVQLWNAAKTNLIAQTTTNSNGNYTLQAPSPGDYRVRVLLPDPTLDQFSPKDS